MSDKETLPPSGASSGADAALPRRRFLQLAGLSAFALAGCNWYDHTTGAAVAAPTPEGALVAPTQLLAAERGYSIIPKVLPSVQTFSLAQVRLLAGPFKHAQELDHSYLLFLEPDRLLSRVRTDAGLAAKAPAYEGWEREGVAGHTLGHYLSALSYMYQSTGDPELKRRIDYIVDEMALCQDKNGDGYVSAIPDGRAMFNDVKAGKGDGVHRGWVPWYTQHKLFAGLRDAYILTGNEKAKTTFLKLADWAIDTTANLSDEQWQIMLTQEHGGMCESMADAYAMTGEQKYLDYAHKFSHRQILDPMSQKQDMLDGFHANTQIPKIVGFRRIYELTADPKYGTASRFFWDTVTQNRTYVTGGNSDHEHFFPPADTRNHLSAETAETCNIYNMLKLTRGLWAQGPNVHDMDWYERALYNQILGSQDPEGGNKGGFNYLNALVAGQFKIYSNPTTAFWCCVGTGIENHAKYGETIYYRDANSLWVNLFIPSELDWAEKDVKLTQETNFPDEDTVKLTIRCAQPTKLALKVRHPSWAKGMTIAVNGKAQTVGQGAGYELIDRTWKDGDVVTLRLPMSLSVEELHAAPEKQALLYGPIVLAANLGNDHLKTLNDYVDSQTVYSGVPLPPAPLFVSADGGLLKQIKQVQGQKLAFTAQMVDSGSGETKTIPMLPYSRAHHIRYGVYFDVLTPAQWQQKRDEIAAEQKRQRELQARTVDEYGIGEQQSEVDHAFKGQSSNTGDFNGRKWRDANNGGFFELNLKTPPAGAAAELMVTYWGSDSGNRNFDILVDGKVIATQKLDNNKPNSLFDVVYAIPTELTQGKDKVTVRFQAKPGGIAGGVFGLRMLKK